MGGGEFGLVVVIELPMSDDLDKLVSSNGKDWNSRKCYFLKRVGQFLKMRERVYMVRLGISMNWKIKPLG